MNRGLAVSLSFKIIASPELITPEAIRQAHLLGWCIELVRFSVWKEELCDSSDSLLCTGMV